MEHPPFFRHHSVTVLLDILYADHTESVAVAPLLHGGHLGPAPAAGVKPEDGVTARPGRLVPVNTTWRIYIMLIYTGFYVPVTNTTLLMETPLRALMRPPPTVPGLG